MGELDEKRRRGDLPCNHPHLPAPTDREPPTQTAACRVTARPSPKRVLPRSFKADPSEMSPPRLRGVCAVAGVLEVEVGWAGGGRDKEREGLGVRGELAKVEVVVAVQEMMPCQTPRSRRSRVDRLVRPNRAKGLGVYNPGRIERAPHFSFPSPLPLGR